ncbi:hypothetical protein HAX54_039470 [Datura stramonium]|uniref:Uncharacterized protein n=1 Tax=Datura stramonium TaxID=4076 RepID=A0ABS8SJ55_DATST|nr:hypothetical protein [Datura stramonium]
MQPCPSATAGVQQLQPSAMAHVRKQQFSAGAGVTRQHCSVGTGPRRPNISARTRAARQQVPHNGKCAVASFLTWHGRRRVKGVQTGKIGFLPQLGKGKFTNLKPNSSRNKEDIKLL